MPCQMQFSSLVCPSPSHHTLRGNMCGQSVWFMCTLRVMGTLINVNIYCSWLLIRSIDLYITQFHFIVSSVFLLVWRLCCYLGKVISFWGHAADGETPGASFRSVVLYSLKPILFAKSLHICQFKSDLSKERFKMQLGQDYSLCPNLMTYGCFAQEMKQKQTRIPTPFEEVDVLFRDVFWHVLT